MNHLPLVALALAFFVAGCQSPLAPTGTQTSLQPGQTRLVIQTEGTRALNLLDANFVTVQLASAAGQETRFASADGGGTGTYEVEIEGLVSGDWALQVRFYATPSSSLLFYANQNHYVEAGRSNNLTLKLYPSGTIDGVGVVEAIPAQRVVVSDLEAGAWSTYGVQPLAIGRPLQLRAEVVGAGNVPASDQRIRWSSSDETILEVSSTGLITGLRPGEATLRATTLVGTVGASFQVVVNLDLVGVWEADVESNQGILVRKAMLEVQRTAKGGLEATLWTGLDQGTAANAHREEIGPLYAAGRSAYLFPRPRIFLNSHGPDWNPESDIQDTEPAVLQVLAAETLVFKGNDRSTGNAPVTWEFRRSALHIDSFDTPLATSVVKLATVGQSLDLGLWSPQWDGYYSPAASNLAWSSSDTGIATVDQENGQVEFLAVGDVTIRAHGTNTPDRVYKVTFEVQAPQAYDPLPEGRTNNNFGAFTHVAADTLSGLGGWLVAGRGHVDIEGSSFGTGYLTRYRANGAPDGDFGANSASLLPLLDLNQFGGVQAREGASTSPGFVQTGGQIHWLAPSLYAGSNYTSNYRFGPSGDLDTSYADMDASIQALADFRATGAPVVDSLDNVYLLGIRTTDGVTVIKKLPDGTVDDETVSSNDFWVSPYTAAAFVGAQIQVAPDNKILLVGNNSGGGEGRVLRLTTTGTLDTTFGSSGSFFRFEEGGGAHTDLKYSALRVANGSIYLTGSSWMYTSDPRYPWQHNGFVVRLTLDGAFDTGFAPGGNHDYYRNQTSPHFVLHHPYRHPQDLEVDSLGRIVLVGRTYTGKAFATRLLPNASGVDYTFGASRQSGDGVILDQGTSSAALSVAIDAQNQVAVAGWWAQTSGYGYPDYHEIYPALWRFE